MESSKTYLKMAAKERAADIFLIAGRRVSFKRGDSLVPISDESLTPEHSAVLIREIYDMANRRFPEEAGVWDDDFSLSVPGLARFRVNVFRQRGSLAAVIRIVQFGIPDKPIVEAFARFAANSAPDRHKRKRTVIGCPVR